MSKNENLHKAKAAKNDEFYTRIEDIEAEMAHYKEHLRGKIVYCPCDDWRWSNFVKYFKEHFHELGLRGLVATNYDIGDGAWKYEYDGVREDVRRLEGNGDFRSEECTRFKDACDIVITNPPFSLFKEFIPWLFGEKTS